MLKYIKIYFNIIKPGIIFGNALSFLGGFFLSSHGQINFFLLFISFLGTIFIISSGCVFNNIIDRDIDKKINRTKNRVLVTRLISLNHAYFFACSLGFIGFLILFFFTNKIVFFIGLFGFVIYVVIYSLLMKRYMPYATLVGSMAGSSPVLMGYETVTNEINCCFFILFLILTFWQIAHFYSIAIFRIEDYRKINIAVFSISNGVALTQLYILINILIFIMFISLLFCLKYVGSNYLIITLFFSFIWFFITLIGCFQDNKAKWSRLSFFFSIIVICIFNLMIGLDSK
ncbi:Protoheme IX farnesyltransferase [Buchnera aphidicola (Thelaxes suberi)]